MLVKGYQGYARKLRLTVQKCAPAGENGGREDVRWVALADKDGAGVAAVSLGGQALHINVSKCGPHILCHYVAHGLVWLATIPSSAFYLDTKTGLSVRSCCVTVRVLWPDRVALVL